MYEKVYTAASPVTFSTGDSFLVGFQFSKYWDAVLGKAGKTWFKIFHDGSFVRYGTPYGSYKTGGRVLGKPAFWEQWGGYIYGVTDVNGMIDFAALNPDYPMTYQHARYPSNGGWFVDDTSLVFAKRLSDNAIAVYSLEDGALLRTISHNLGITFDAMFWASSGVICAIRYSDGYVCFFDYLTDRGVLETGKLETCRLATYDCVCKVFWTYGYDNLVRIYVRNDQPVNLSSPVFTGTPQGMAVRTVKVRLTGVTGEPCPGYWVHWELAASGGLGPYGTLEFEVSKTDEDGYASNNYYGPLDGSFGGTVVNTWVEL
jgi:hypothetical protein